MNEKLMLNSQILDFSIVDAKMSPDLKYCDTYIAFFDSDEEKQKEILEKLNKS